MVKELFKKAPSGEESCCMPGEGLDDEEFAGFCKTPEAIKRIPNGKLQYPDGTTVFVDGAGQLWTAKQWEKRFGYKPAKVWNRMKKLRLLPWDGTAITTKISQSGG